MPKNVGSQATIETNGIGSESVKQNSKKKDIYMYFYQIEAEMLH